ncbi:hypothetical protein CEN45_05090 [Fischerella thermalis CCMEE 5198]|jgi:hypothetical protein|uniref:hypothetical protein n=1 Tax=Fischerella thermalis TaxID=372787 RepID=UPI000C7FF1E8|nr:hypothetical protein [Fischerella thermalis]PLZ85374.1 hypothetical protein CI594_23030 [Fischerella thermalis CCMEE 5196]PMB25861.1 hypothetical protein CEN45_05090 [Fischerella thermalis CCMEE 5198]
MRRRKQQRLPQVAGSRESSRTQQQAQQATARANYAELLLQQEKERSQRLAGQLRSLGIQQSKSNNHLW